MSLNAQILSPSNTLTQSVYCVYFWTFVTMQRIGHFLLSSLLDICDHAIYLQTDSKTQLQIKTTLKMSKDIECSNVNK